MYGGTRRVVITGMSVISSVGNTVDEFWDNLVHARSGIGRITAFDAKALKFEVLVAGEVKNFQPEEWLNPKMAKRVHRCTHFSVAAAKLALANSGLNLEQEDRSRVGIELGTGIGGSSSMEKEMVVFAQEGWRKISATNGPNVMINASAYQVAAELGVNGPNHTIVASCASSLQSLGESARRVAMGLVDVVFAGGAEAPVYGSVIGTFSVLRALSRLNDDPATACRPFDATRNGTVISEGAAFFVLESAERAIRRGAKIYGEILGYGITQDAFHLVAPEPQGKWAAQAMHHALREAELKPRQIDYIVAHGTATELNDVSETIAIKQVFGERDSAPPISSNKAVIGHSLGAAGAFSTVAALKAIETSLIPPTANLHHPDPRCDLDFVPLEARPASVARVMINAFGFGGQNSSLVVGKFEG